MEQPKLTCATYETTAAYEANASALFSQFVTDLLKIEENNKRVIEVAKEEIALSDQEVKQTVAKLDKKAVKRHNIFLKTKLNTDIRAQETDLADRVHERLAYIEMFKNTEGFLHHNFDPTVKELYLLLSRQGRLNVRYVKLPKCWLSIGLFAGILEDLIVILRTPEQIGLGSSHLFTIKNIIEGIELFNIAEIAEGNPVRFLFITKLFEKSFEEISLTLERCVQSQGASRRIGIFKEPKVVTEENKENDDTFTTESVVTDTVYTHKFVPTRLYLYAIQGLYGNIVLDPRVTKTLTVDNTPPFGVHFTKEIIAMSIWGNKPNGKVVGGRVPPPGTICKFDRPIHGLTCVEYNERSFQIAASHTCIRDRMVHGINDAVSRPKYQAGLVINLKRLCEVLPCGAVKMNELGTLLVYEDIPFECLVECLHTNDDLDTFWRI